MTFVKKHRGIRGLFAAALVVSLSGCGGMVTTGNQSAGVSGAAGGATSAGAEESLQRCDAPLGTIAVDDGRNADWFGPFGRATQVTTIEPLLRLAVQQSNCFVITSVGNQNTDARLSPASRNCSATPANTVQVRNSRKVNG